MKKKRFVKLCMSRGYDRNTANIIARAVVINQLEYFNCFGVVLYHTTEGE